MKFANLNLIYITKQKAFTIIELLVVVAIIGILAAVGVVAYSGYMEGSKSSRVMSNCAEAHSFISSNLKYCEINPSASTSTSYEWSSAS